MKQQFLFLLFFFGVLLVELTSAQDNLPSFKIKPLQDGKVFISWHNPYSNCIKLMVQRSTDEKKYITIASAKNPSLSNNSYTDTQPLLNFNTFYRIQYTLKNGATIFTKSLHIQNKENIVKTETQNSLPGWKVSPYVFSNNSGYIQMKLDKSSEYKYSVKFLDDKENLVLKINQINSDNLILDKTNFIHAGWFQFELYRNDVLLEKNSVYLKEN